MSCLQNCKKNIYFGLRVKNTNIFLLMYVDISGHSNAYRNKILHFWPVFTIFTIFVISYQEWGVRGYFTAHSQYKMKVVKLIKIHQKGEIVFLCASEWAPISINVKRKNICVFYQKAKDNFFLDNFVNMIYVNIFSLIGTF